MTLVVTEREIRNTADSVNQYKSQGTEASQKPKTEERQLCTGYSMLILDLLK